MDTTFPSMAQRATKGAQGLRYALRDERGTHPSLAYTTSLLDVSGLFRNKTNPSEQWLMPEIR